MKKWQNEENNGCDPKAILQELQRNYLQVLCTLGYGTFGRVKLVRFKGDEKDGDTITKPINSFAFIEISIIGNFASKHSESVQIFFYCSKSTFQDFKHVYMLFEYIQGGQLFSRLTKNGRFCNDVCLFYVSGIVDAITYLHHKEIVFRDLKPENIMVDTNGFPKLIDLGFAKKLNHFRTFTICGTPEYLAPQMLQKSNKSGYGKTVDYWGIGILIYQLLAGYPPFYDNEQPKNIYKKILKGIIEFPQFFSLRAKHLILHLLNPNPNKRLGAKDNGQEIKKHAWFRRVNWADLRRCKVPWKPAVKDLYDVSHFEEVSASRGTTMSISDPDQQLFEGF